MGLFSSFGSLFWSIFDWIRRLLCRWFGILCPCSPNPPLRTCPIGWQPSVVAPVFYGVRDLGAAEGAPGPVRVFFPSLDGAVFDAPILEGCSRYPLIIFCHGHCSQDVDHYKKWFEIPAELARSGYVVAVPLLPEVGGGTHPSGADGDLALLQDLTNWMRTGWEHRDVLLPDPATGVVGHSFGALLAGRFATTASVGAYASLSGVWQDWPDSNRPIQSLRIPKLFTWGDDLLDLFASLDSGGLWGTIPVTKHKAAFAGAAHWDYLRAGRTACASARGDCDLVRLVASDLLCTFFGKYLPPESWPNLRTCVPDSLIPPAFHLTTEQEFYAGGHLQGFKLMQGHKECSVTISWQTSQSAGSVTKP